MVEDHTAGPRNRHARSLVHGQPPAPDGPTRTLATILDPEGNRIGLAGHAPSP
jgi:hypothetical protein